MKACVADLRWTNRKYSKISARMTGGGRLLGVWRVAAALLAGCGGSPGPGRPGPRQAIEAAMRRYVDASNKGDAATLASLYADDAMLLPPDHEPIRGREAIGAFWRQGTDEGLAVTNLAVEVDGNLGYLVGRYHLPRNRRGAGRLRQIRDVSQAAAGRLLEADGRYLEPEQRCG